MKKLFYILATAIVILLFNNAVHAGYISASSSDSDSSALVNSLISYYNGDIQEAINDIKNVKDSKDIRNYLLLQQAQQYQNAGQLKAAIEEYKTILQSQPTGDIAKISRLGLSICKYKDKSSKYLILLIIVLVFIPPLSFVMVKKVLIFDTLSHSRKMRSAKNYNDALSDLETIIKAYPDERKQLYNDMGEIAIEAGLTDARAMAIYENAMHNGNKNPAIISFLARSYANAARYDESAKDVYSNVLNLEMKQAEKFDLMRSIANAALVKMNLGDALKYYRILNKQYPNDPDIIYNLAFIYVKKEEFDEDIEQLILKTIETHPPRNDKDINWMFISYLGNKYMIMNRDDVQAMDIYEKLLSHDPANIDVSMRLSSAYLSGNEYTKAINILNNTLSLYPDNINVYVYLAEAYQGEKLHSNVIETAKRGISIDNSNIQLLTMLCDAYIATNNYGSEAMQAFETILNVLPQVSSVRERVNSALALGYLAKGDRSDKAIEVYEAALKSHSDKELLQFMAQLYFDKKEIQKAAEKFVELIKLDRDNPQLNYKLTTILNQLDKAGADKIVSYYAKSVGEPVVKLYERVFEKHSSDFYVTSKLKDIYKEQKITDQNAIKVYEALLNIKDNPEVRFELADIYLINNKIDEAKKEYQKIIAMNPDNIRAREQLADLNNSTNDEDGAISQLEEIYKRTPDNKQVIDKLAGLYATKKLTEPKTLNIYYKALQNNPKNESLYLFFATALFKSANYQKASDTLMQLVNLNQTCIPDVIQMHKSMEDIGYESAEFYMNFAELETMVKNINEAVDYYRKAYKLSQDKIKIYIDKMEKIYLQYPTNRLAMRFLLDLYLANKNFDKASAIGEEILKLAPNDSSVNRAMSTIYETMAEETGSLSTDYTSLLDRALKFNPNNTEIIPRLEKAYRMQLKQKPDDIDKRLIFSELLIKNGKINDAITELQKALEYAKAQKKSELEHAIGLKLGNMYMKVDMRELAIEVFDDLLKRDDVNNENIEAFYNLAKMHEQTDNIQKAKDIYKRIVNFRFNYRDAATRLKAITTGSYAKSPSTPFTLQSSAPSQVYADPTSTVANNSNVIIEHRVLPLNYKPVKKLGEGGMGIVYLVKNETLNRLEAIKYIKEKDSAKDPEELIRRFMKEARAAAALKHENIVTIYEASEEKRYILMEYVEGTSVMKLLQKKERLMYYDVAKIGYKVANGLYYAHNKGIYHRDISPDNILVSDDYETVKILDFGVARISAEFSESITKVVGKILYMSPEQEKGSDDIDGRTDIYALGVTMYQMLTNTLPFSSDNIENKYTEDPLPPSKRFPDIDRRMDTVILKCLKPKKEDRYKDAKQLSDALIPLAGTIIEQVQSEDTK
jgi:tetratricopeptide (TPR) repeat protein